MSSQDVLSEADSLSGSFVTGGHTTAFGPIGQVSGIAPPAFHHIVKIGAFGETFSLDPTSLIDPTLQINATDLTNTASSDGLGIDNISTQSTSDIASASIVLTGAVSSTLEILGLSVAATFIHSNSSASYVFGPDRGFVSGDASFQSLSISGSLIGGKTLTFSGDAAPNTVLYHSPTVTITLDQQTLSDFLPPSPVASGTPPILPNRITTDALNIQLTDAPLLGVPITGHISLGETSATYFSSPIVPPVPV